MGSDGNTATDVTTARLRLKADADEITHLVCCRDEPWKFAFCGFETAAINMAAENFCSMCVAEVERLLPDVHELSHPHCPKDRRRCPDLFDVEKRVLSETSP